MYHYPELYTTLPQLIVVIKVVFVCTCCRVVHVFEYVFEKFTFFSSQHMNFAKCSSSVWQLFIFVVKASLLCVALWYVFVELSWEQNILLCTPFVLLSLRKKVQIILVPLPDTVSVCPQAQQSKCNSWCNFNCYLMYFQYYLMCSHQQLMHCKSTLLTIIDNTNVNIISPLMETTVMYKR